MTTPHPIIMPILLTAGCAEAPASTARTYVQAATLAPTDPVQAATLCRSLKGEHSLECLTLTAHAAASADPDLAIGLCQEIRPGLWQDECFFLVAEAVLPVRGGEAAARLCFQAGRFGVNCMDHVWRAHAGTLLRTSTPAEAARAYAQAIRWAEGMGEPDAQGLQERFWQKLYDAPLLDSSLPPIDIAWCPTLPEDLAISCPSAMPAALRRSLARIEQEATIQGRPIDRGVFCADGDPLQRRVAQAFGLRYVPSAPLDEAVERAVGWLCHQARPPGRHLPPRP